MYIYKDFDYVNYILNLPVDDGLSFYFKCVERSNNEIFKIDDDRLWQAFIQQGKEGQTFDDFKNEIGYYNKLKENTEGQKPVTKHKSQMTNEEKLAEVERIKGNVINIRKIIEEKDKQIQLNEIKNQVVEGG